MARVYVFADEAGTFAFNTNPSSGRYFILTTVTMQDCSFGNDLLELRRQMAWRGIDIEAFHATEDLQAVRDEVFDVLKDIPCRVDCTVLDKRKTLPRLQTRDSVYKLAWYLHSKYVIPRVTRPGDELLVTAASLGTKSERRVFTAQLKDVMQQVGNRRKWKVAFWPASTDPCLQIADYFSWAVQRKWERGDPRSYDLVKHRIRSEFDVFSGSIMTYF